MTSHHEVGIQMADAAWRSGSDPRLRLFADQIRHAQGGQLPRMRAIDTSPEEAATDSAMVARFFMMSVE